MRIPVPSEEQNKRNKTKKTETTRSSEGKRIDDTLRTTSEKMEPKENRNGGKIDRLTTRKVHGETRVLWSGSENVTTRENQ